MNTQPSATTKRSAILSKYGLENYESDEENEEGGAANRSNDEADDSEEEALKLQVLIS